MRGSESAGPPKKAKLLALLAALVLLAVLVVAGFAACSGDARGESSRPEQPGTQADGGAGRFRPGTPSADGPHRFGPAQQIAPAQATTISAGSSHTMAIDADGTLWGWGNLGNVGLNRPIADTSHVPVRIMENARAVEASQGYTLVIDNGGRLWGWGSNGANQLGVPNEMRWESDIAEPTLIMANVTAVAAGALSSFAIDADGWLWGWGRRFTHVDFNTVPGPPVQIMRDAIAVAAGRGNMLAITSDNALWRMGGGYGAPERIMENVASVSVQNTPGMSGDGFAAAITLDGDLYMIRLAWEETRYEKIMGNASAVSLGDTHAMAVTADGALWGWHIGVGIGDGFALLGDGTAGRAETPVKIMENVVSVSAGPSHTVALTTDGSLWAWGSNDLGRLGTGDTVANHSPVRVMGDAQSAHAGNRRSVAVTQDGALWAWGAGLPQGDEDGRGRPTRFPHDGAAFTSAAAVANRDLGIAVTFAIDAGGDLLELRGLDVFRSWTRGEASVKSFSAASSFLSQSDHLLAVTDDGGLLAFEEDGATLFGNPRFVAVRIADNMAAVDVGPRQTLAITTDGALLGWGENSGGNLGPENPVDRSEPVRFMENIVAVSQGMDGNASYGMAIDSGGALWGWGNNMRWQLGLHWNAIDLGFDNWFGNFTRSPVRIMDNVAAVSAGGLHAMAIDRNGTLWGWGANDEGQLGDGTTVNRPEPVRIMDNVAAVSAGQAHTLAITTAGDLYAWGANGAGELGTGATSAQREPRMVMGNIMLPGSSH